MAARSRRSELPTWLLLLRNLAVAFALVALVQGLLFRVFAIPTGSMQNTLNPRDRVVVNLRAYDTATPGRGDIVVFRHGDTWDTERKPASPSEVVNVARNVGDFLGVRPSNYGYTVKRVIAVGGDTASCCDADGRVTVNGEALDEPYVFEDLPFEAGTLDCDTEPRSPRCFAAIGVPEGELLLLGDHRSRSADSVLACRGAASAGDCALLVNAEQVVGKVMFSLLPPRGVR